MIEPCSPERQSRTRELTSAVVQDVIRTDRPLAEPTLNRPDCAHRAARLLRVRPRPAPPPHTHPFLRASRHPAPGGVRRSSNTNVKTPTATTRASDAGMGHQQPPHDAATYAPHPKGTSHEQRQQRQQGQQGQQGQQRADGPRRQQGQRREQQATRNLPRVSGQGQRSVNDDAPKPEAPAAASTPEPAAGSRGGDAATDLLEQIRTALRRRNQGLIATMLNGSCRIIEQGEDTVTLGFLPNYQQVHMQKVSDAASDVGAAASEVLKRQVSVRCVPVDGATTGGDGNARGADRPTGQQPKEGVIQREARSRFGARPYQSN